MTFLPRPCFLLVIVFGFVPIRFWESVAKENLVFFRPLYLFCFRPQLIQFIHIINVCYQYEAAGIFTCTPIRVLDRPFYRAEVILTRSFAYKKSCSNHCFSLLVRNRGNANHNTAQQPYIPNSAYLCYKARNTHYKIRPHHHCISHGILDSYTCYL